jgi:ParB/RepB/Spo0J family partition protein
LLLSIQQQNILQPLLVVQQQNQQHCVLLDGFKRYRCAQKLGIKNAPVDIIGTDVVSGIVTLLQRNASKGLTTFEQAALVDELHRHHNMNIYDIAQCLQHSPSWVSKRLGFFDDLSDLVREKIMSGAFPTRAYMYQIRMFTRVHKVSASSVDACVKALSGKQLSTRELAILIPAYFTGKKELQELIDKGDAHKVLTMIKDSVPSATTAVSPKEHALVTLLKRIVLDIRNLCNRSKSINECNDLADLNNINIWCAELKVLLPQLQKTVQDLYDNTTRKTNNSTDTIPAGVQ